MYKNIEQAIFFGVGYHEYTKKQTLIEFEYGTIPMLSFCQHCQPHFPLQIQ